MKIYIAALAAAALMAGCTQSVKETSSEFNDLPPAVQTAVKAQAPDAQIASVNKDTRDGRVVYDIEFKDTGRNPKMTVALDGTILRNDAAIGAVGSTTAEIKGSATTKSQLSALPESVRKTVQSRVGSAEIADVKAKEENGRMIYEIEFKDKGKNPTMKIAADGTVVESLQK